MIPIYIPNIENYKESAINAINDNWISNYGVNIKNSEEKLKKILNVKYCILMNNGTSATHCLFLALKFKYPNVNKIYVPNNVFIAAWNCCLMEYDKEQLEVMKINTNTLNIDTSEEYFKTLDKDSCVLIVHNLGNVINVPRLKRVRPDLIFIEDNCEGIFGTYEDKSSGCYEGTLCSSVSFYANKTLTTGEGGAFFTNDKEIFNYLKSAYSHGMTKQRYIHDVLAFNYRMTNIQAGFLYDQLNDLDNILLKKRNIFENYNLFLKDFILNSTIRLPEKEKNTQQSYWMYCIIIDKLDFKNFETYMNEKFIEIRPFFYDIRKHKHLNDIPVKYNESNVFSCGVILPSYPSLEKEKQEYISNCIKSYLKE